MSLLAELLKEDGVKFTNTSGSNWQAHCFVHKDDSPSLSVDVTKGVYYCFGCQAKGNAYTYLTDYRSMSDKEAVEYMVAHGEWNEHKVAHEITSSDDMKQEAEDKKKRLPKWHKQIWTKHQGLPLFKEHDYRDADGRLILKVCRYEGLKHGKRKKSFMQYTPAKRGGWWLCKATNENLPDEDRADKIPLFGLKTILKTKQDDLPIFFAEGEKKVLAMHNMPMPNDAPKRFGTCCVAGGSSAKLEEFDWTPLRNRKVVLIADADKVGRGFMKRVGKHLKNFDCKLKYVLPSGDGGYDIADVLMESGWGAAAQWIKQHTVKKPTTPEEPVVFDNPTPVKEGEEEDFNQHPLVDTDHFRILGMDQSGTNVNFLKKALNTVLVLPASRLNSEGSLNQLAPLQYWKDMAQGSFNAATRMHIADGLMRAAESVGIADHSSLTPKGRGCYRTDEGDLLWNLGDRYYCDVVNGVFTREQPLDNAPILLEPGARINIVSDLSKAEQYAKDWYDSLMAYRFESPTHARRFVGWSVASLIGGALPFRPMAWLSAPAKTGKTFLVNDVMRKFFGPFAVKTADQTAAGIAQRARSESVPVIIDEFEPEEGTEARWRDMLALIRLATSGDYERLRGTLSGVAVSTSPRFCAIVISIHKPVLTEQDATRLVPIKLSSVGVLNWPEVRDKILYASTERRLQIVRSYLIKNSPRILDKVKEVSRTMEGVHDMDTRSVQIHSALTGAAGFVSGVFESTWSKPQVEERTYELLKYMFACRVKINNSRDKTLAGILMEVQEAERNKFENPENHRHITNFAQQYGFKFYYDEIRAEHYLLVAYETPALVQLMRNSSFGRHVSIRDNLLQIKGVRVARSETGKPLRARFADQQRLSVAVPQEVLQHSGLDTSALFEEEDESFIFDGEG